MLISIKNIPNNFYKKTFGSWGESCVDEWMHQNGWVPYLKNRKIHHGEIDRIYKFIKQDGNKLYCVSEIKTIFCKNKKTFLSCFTEIGLSSLIKHRQILNLYKIANNIQTLQNKKLLKTVYINQNMQTKMNVYVRFFIVLKMYQDYEKELLFKIQKNFKVCLKTQDKMIISFLPEYYV